MATQNPRVTRAIEAAQRGTYGEAVRLLEDEAVVCGGAESLPPRALTTYAVALAETNRRRMQTAIDLCRHAVEREFVDADLFADMARVYFAARMRRRALEAVERGLAIEGDHTRLLALRKELGMRRVPVLSFLARSHPVNVFFGRLRHRLAGPPGA